MQKTVLKSDALLLLIFLPFLFSSCDTLEQYDLYEFYNENGYVNEDAVISYFFEFDLHYDLNSDQEDLLPDYLDSENFYLGTDPNHDTIEKFALEHLEDLTVDTEYFYEYDGTVNDENLIFYLEEKKYDIEKYNTLDQMNLYDDDGDVNYLTMIKYLAELKKRDPDNWWLFEEYWEELTTK